MFRSSVSPILSKKLSQIFPMQCSPRDFLLIVPKFRHHPVETNNVYAKNLKLHPVPPSIPLEALLISKNSTYSASDAMALTEAGCNFMFFYSILDCFSIVVKRHCIITYGVIIVHFNT